MTELFVYKTKITSNKEGQKNTTFDKYKASYRGYNFDLYFTDECRKTFEYEVKEFPVTLLVNDDDYFLKKKKFTRTDGTKGEKWTIVVSGYDSFKKAEFTRRSIDDIIDDLEKDSKGDE